MGGLPWENESSALSLSGSLQKQVPNNLNSNGTESKPQKKICCACPDTKKLRDECIVKLLCKMDRGSLSVPSC